MTSKEELAKAITSADLDDYVTFTEIIDSAIKTLKLHKQSWTCYVNGNIMPTSVGRKVLYDFLLEKCKRS